VWLRHARVWFLSAECDFHTQSVIFTSKVWFPHKRAWFWHLCDNNTTVTRTRTSVIFTRTSCRKRRFDLGNFILFCGKTDLEKFCLNFFSLFYVWRWHQTTGLNFKTEPVCVGWIECDFSKVKVAWALQKKIGIAPNSIRNFLDLVLSLNHQRRRGSIEGRS
jgi:hypothetical protein